MAPPPGYKAYGSAPTPTQNVSRVNGVATAGMVLVGIAGVVGLLAALTTSGIRSGAQDYLDGRISESEFNDQLVSTSALSILAGVVTIAAMVLVMIWMYKMASNLRAFGISTTWHPLFAVFGWFLPPIVLYVIPFLMLREHWTKSSLTAVPGQPAGPTPDDAKSDTPVLWVWWLAFGIWPLATLFLSAGGAFSGIGATSADDVAQNLVDTNQTLTTVGAVISFVAAIAWIAFARQLTARHRALTGER